MAKDSARQQQHLRQIVAQQAARMMAEEGIVDYGFAKRKAARQLGMEDSKCLPANSEIDMELRIQQGIFHAEEHAATLQQLRIEALAIMRLLERFDPQLTGPVLDGTAGRHAETDIHLFADSDKDVEIFLLNNKIPYQSGEKSYHYGGDRRKLPMFTLEGPSGPVKLVVFSPQEARILPRHTGGEGTIARARLPAVEDLLSEKP